MIDRREDFSRDWYGSSSMERSSRQETFIRNIYSNACCGSQVLEYFRKDGFILKQSSHIPPYVCFLVFTYVCIEC